MNELAQPSGPRTVSAPQWLTRGFMIAALLAVLSAMLGAYRAYTPVPVGDMWDGLASAVIMSEDTSTWWALHNEHRIILSRILFWLDLSVFGGTGKFLIAINYVLVAVSAALFLRIGSDRWQRALSQHHHSRWQQQILGSLLVIWLFHWMQLENLTWSFQSQFFLAQLLPLAALYSMFRATDAEEAHSTRWYILGCILGVLSAGTMANGTVALPLLAVYALVTRQTRPRILALAVLAVLIPLLYFTDFVRPEQHGSLTSTLLGEPLAALTYVFLYIGSPFYYLLGAPGLEGLGYGVTLLATGIMAISSLSLLAFYLTRGADKHPLPVALIFYIAYIAGTALGTAGGRLVFGVEQALASRYTTPALMAWAAWFILVLPVILRAFQRYRVATTAAVTGFLVLLLYHQAQAIHQRYQSQHDRKLAGLAIELRVQDDAQLSHVYPFTESFHERFQFAPERNIGVFGIYPLVDRREQLGNIYQDSPLPPCIGYLDFVEPIATDPAFYRVQGWLADRQSRRVPELITIINTASEVAGFALGGQPRDDVRAEVGRYARNAGFRGYIHADRLNEPARLIATDPTCELRLDMPASGTILAPQLSAGVER